MMYGQTNVQFVPLTCHISWKKQKYDKPSGSLNPDIKVSLLRVLDCAESYVSYRKGAERPTDGKKAKCF